MTTIIMQVGLLEIAPNTDQDVSEAMAKLIPLLTDNLKVSV